MRPVIRLSAGEIAKGKRMLERRAQKTFERVDAADDEGLLRHTVDDLQDRLRRPSSAIRDSTMCSGS